MIEIGKIVKNNVNGKLFLVKNHFDAIHVSHNRDLYDEFSGVAWSLRGKVGKKFPFEELSEEVEELQERLQELRMIGTDGFIYKTQG